MKKKCSHKTRQQVWVVEEHFDGPDTGYWESVEVPTFVDIDIGRFKCTQCGEVGYYTGKWREYWEGIENK